MQSNTIRHDEDRDQLRRELEIVNERLHGIAQTHKERSPIISDSKTVLAKYDSLMREVERFSETESMARGSWNTLRNLESDVSHLSDIVIISLVSIQLKLTEINNDKTKSSEFLDLNDLVKKLNSNSTKGGKYYFGHTDDIIENFSGNSLSDSLSTLISKGAICLMRFGEADLAGFLLHKIADGRFRS